MFDQCLPILQSGQIPEFIWAVTGNVASEVLIRMTTDRVQAVFTEKDFKQKIAEGFIAALKVEPDPHRQEILARCLCDDLVIKEITETFAKGNFSEDSIRDLAKARLPDHLTFDEVESLLGKGIHSLVEAFNNFIADDQSLIYRTLIERTAETASSNRRVETKLEEVVKSIIEFTSSTDRGSSPQSGVSTTATQISPISIVGESFPEHANIFVKEDFEKGLSALKTGSARKAREIFSTVVERLEKMGFEQDRLLYFRAKSNLGVAVYLCGTELELAAAYLDESFQYCDGSLKGRTNKAFAFSLRGNDEGALVILNGILTETPNHFDALVQKADCLGRLGRKDEALVILREVKPENTEQKLVYSAILCGFEDYAAIETVSRSILETDPNNPWGKQTLSHAIAVPLIEQFNKEKTTSAFRSRADRESMRQAISLLEDALPEIKKSERTDTIATTLTNLCAYYLSIGEIKKSLDYAEQAMNFGELQKSLLQNRFLVAILGREFGIALSSAELLRDHFPESDWILMKLEALHALGKHSEALAFLQEEASKNPALLTSSSIRVLEVDLTLNLPDIEAATVLSESLLAGFPNEPFVWLTAANVAHENENPAEEEYLKTALKLSTQPGLSKLLQGILGTFYGGQFKWQEALECFYPEGTDLELPTPHQIEAATCYFNLGKHKTALDLCKLKLSQGYDSLACDLAIQSCLAMFDLSAAKVFAERMQHEDHKNQVTAWAYLAHLEIRFGNPEAARKLLVAAIKREKAPARLLIMLSTVCLQLGRKMESLKYAFEAVEKAEDQFVLTAHHAVARVGLSPFEDINIDDADKLKIQSSVTYLASTDDSGFSAIPVDPGFGALRQMLRTQQKNAREGQRMFSEQGFPVYFLSRMSGKDLYETWKALISGNGDHVKMAIGSQEEQDTQLQRARTCEGVVIDATALLTFRMLGLLEYLPKIFKQVSVSFLTFEYFRSLISQASAGSQSSGFISLVGEQFQMQEFREGSKEAEACEFLTPIFEFLNSEVVKKYGFIRPEVEDEVGSIFESCSQPAFASMVLAKSLSLPLLCDDTGTLQVARLAFEIDGFCTQAALRTGVLNKVMAESIYSDAVIKLYASNYRFVSEDPDGLISYLSRHEWELTPVIRKLFERFDQGEVNQQASCKIMGTILAHAWMRAKSPTSLPEHWLKFICERLCSRSPEVVNIQLSLVGAALTFIEVPECFFDFAKAFERIALPAKLKKNLRGIPNVIAWAIAADEGKLLGPSATRWRA